MARLVIEKGAEKGRTLRITKTLVVGRDTQVDIPVQDLMVSRTHCKIEPRSDGFYLVDLNSLNGTYLNGKQVKTAALQLGDVIKVGSTIFSFSLDDGIKDQFIGQMIGKYRIIKRLGRGGMGTVYEAKHEDLDRLVAVKIVAPEYAGDKSFVDMFMHEARYAAKLNHPNVVQIYDVGHEEGLYYYTMEFVPGGSVHEFLLKQPGKKLSIDQAMEITTQMALALEYAHSKGIIHRDVKPENMLIGEGGVIKLTDLGLAHTMGEKIQLEGKSDYVFGTPLYMAPEILKGKIPDYRSDTYSLGASFYLMLTGRHAFDVTSMEDYIAKKTTIDPLPVHKRLVDCPPELSKITSKMIARDPVKRYQSVQEVVSELDGFKASYFPSPKKEKKNIAVIIAIILGFALLVVTIAALAGVFSGNSNTGGKNNNSGKEKINETPVTNKTPAELAEAAFGQILGKYQKNPDDYQVLCDTIEGLEKLVNDYSGTPTVDKAKTKLDELLLEKEAITQIKKVKEEDRKNYIDFINKLKNDSVDRSLINDTREKYYNLKKFEGTRAYSNESNLQTRAGDIERWLEKVLDIKGQYKNALETGEDKNYAKLVANLNSFLDQMEGHRHELDDPFDERYKILIYDKEAEKMKTSIEEKAEEELAEKIKLVKSKIKSNDFDGARDLLRDKHRFEGITNLTRQIEEAWNEISTAEKSLLSEKERKELEADALKFSSIPAKVYNLSKEFKFKEGTELLTKEQKNLKTDKYRKIIQSRIDILKMAENCVKELEKKNENVTFKYLHNGKEIITMPKIRSNSILLNVTSGKTPDPIHLKSNARILFAKVASLFIDKRSIEENRDYCAVLFELGILDEAQSVLKNNFNLTMPNEIKAEFQLLKNALEAESDVEFSDVKAQKLLDISSLYVEARLPLEAEKSLQSLEKQFANFYTENKSHVDKIIAKITLLKNEILYNLIQDKIIQEKAEIDKEKKVLERKIISIQDIKERDSILSAFYMAHRNYNESSNYVKGILNFFLPTKDNFFNWENTIGEIRANDYLFSLLKLKIASDPTQKSINDTIQSFKNTLNKSRKDVDDALNGLRTKRDEHQKNFNNYEEDRKKRIYEINTKLPDDQKEEARKQTNDYYDKLKEREKEFHDGYQKQIDDVKRYMKRLRVNKLKGDREAIRNNGNLNSDDKKKRINEIDEMIKNIRIKSLSDAQAAVPKYLNETIVEYINNCEKRAKDALAKHKVLDTKLKNLEKEFKANPKPEKLADIAFTYLELDDLYSARGCARAYIEIFTEESYMKDGFAYFCYAVLLNKFAQFDKASSYLEKTKSKDVYSNLQQQIDALIKDSEAKKRLLK